MSTRVCAGSAAQPDFTLCGDAFDSGDADEPHVEAKKGQAVTCPKCCAVIQEIREMKYRCNPRAEGV